MKKRVRSLAPISGLRIWHCRELWYAGRRRSLDPVLLWLRHRPGSCSSNLTPTMGTSPCPRYGPKRKKEKKKNPPVQGYTVSWPSWSRSQGDARRVNRTECAQLTWAAQCYRKAEEALGPSQLSGDSADGFSAAAQVPEPKREGSLGT